MKKYLGIVLIIIMLMSATGVAFTPRVAHASCIPMSALFRGFDPIDCISIATSVALAFSARVTYLSGFLFNSAMNATMNMGKFVGDNEGGVSLAWRAIRDVASMLFIFLLLYASIAMLINVESSLPSPKDLIRNIILCGLLINFSLFFTKVAIDASNMVTLGLYNAIAPATTAAGSLYSLDGNLDGGISAILMNEMRVSTVYSPKGLAGEPDTPPGYKILLATSLGTIVMICTAISFFVVTIMLIIRICILILLMAFSPIFFVSLVLPATKEYSNMWVKYFTAQLFFPPVYLALMYVALRIITAPAFKSFVGGGNRTFAEAFASASTAPSGTAIITHYAVIIIMINAALVAAISVAGKVGEWGKKYSKAMGTLSWSGKYGIKGAGYGAGFLASKAASSEYLKDKAASSRLGALALKGLGGVAKKYDENIAKKTEAHTKFAESLGYNKAEVARLQGELSAPRKRLLEKMNELEMARIELRNISKNDPGNIAAITATQARVDALKVESDNIRETDVKPIENKIDEAKKSRSTQYGKTINKPSVKTLWVLGVAKEDRQAAAKLELETKKKAVEEAEKKLGDSKSEVTRLVNKAKSNQGITVAEQADLKAAQEDVVEKQEKLDKAKVELANKELEVK
jgi:hypothetical protein